MVEDDGELRGDAILPNRGPVEDCRVAEAVDKARFPDHSIRQADTAGPEISRRSCSTIGRVEIYEIHR